MQAGLTATEQLWPPIRQAYAWLHQAAHLLANAEQRAVPALKQVTVVLFGRKAYEAHERVLERLLF